MIFPTFVWYNESSDYNWLPGHWLSELDTPGEGSMFYQDSFGVVVSPSQLDRKPSIYLHQNNDTGGTGFSPQAPTFAIVVRGLVIIGVSIVVTSVDCYRIADQTRKEVDEWDHNHSGNPLGGDKLAHCKTTCIIRLKTPGTPCAVLAALSSERGGTPFGRKPVGRDSIEVEKANFDGVDCASTILGGLGSMIARFVPNWVPGNNWLDCGNCCRKKGYRRWH